MLFKGFRIVSFVILSMTILSSCKMEQERDDSSDKVTIAVSANLSYAIDELIDDFKQRTGIECSAIISSSGKLTTQIIHGAPYDVFLSADMTYPKKLHSMQLTTDKPEKYASGQLVLWSKYPVEELSDLTSKKYRHIAMANEYHAPYGMATIKALKKDKLWDSIDTRLIHGESISQVNQFIQSNSAEAGFTSYSAMLTPSFKNHGHWIHVDPSLYPSIDQGMVILKKGKKTTSEQFYNYMKSDAARRILQKHGYR